MRRKEIRFYMKLQRDQRQQELLEQCEIESKEANRRLQSLKDLENYTLRNRKKNQIHHCCLRQTRNERDKKSMKTKVSGKRNPKQSKVNRKVRKDDRKIDIATSKSDAPLSTIECKKHNLLDLELKDNDNTSLSIPTISTFADNKLTKEYWELSPVMKHLKRFPHSLYITQKRVSPPPDYSTKRPKKENISIFNVVSSILRHAPKGDHLTKSNNDFVQDIEEGQYPYSIISYMADILCKDNQEKTKHSILCHDTKESNVSKNASQDIPSLDKQPKYMIACPSTMLQSCRKIINTKALKDGALTVDADIVDIKLRNQSFIQDELKGKENDIGMNSKSSTTTISKESEGGDSCRTAVSESYQSIMQKGCNSQQSQDLSDVSSRAKLERMDMSCTSSDRSHCTSSKISHQSSSKQSQQSSISFRVDLDNVEKLSIKRSTTTRIIKGDQEDVSQNSISSELTSSKSPHRLFDESSDDDCSYSNESFSSETL